MIKICVSGSKGRMGTRILALARDESEIEISGSFDIGEDAASAIAVSDCLIEFTTPEVTMEHLALCDANKKAIVIGTTGIPEIYIEKIRDVSKRIPVVLSPNMSVGVNVLFKVVETAARILGHEYTAEILEAHHVHKKDSPSGTAKEAANIIKEARPHTKVPIESIREDDIVGEHTVTFESPLDTLEFTHSAKTRDIFAKGALAAAKFLTGKAPGLYSMKDVLGI